MPRTSCGAPMAFGCSRWTRIFTAVANAECVGACLQARRPLRRPAADLHGACRAVARPRPARSGAGPDGSRLYLSDHFTNQILGHPAATPSSPSPRPTASPSGSIEGTDHPWSRFAELRDAVRDRRTLQCPVDRRKERLPSPAQARQAWHAAISIETNLCPRNRHLLHQAQSHPRQVRLAGRRFTTA